jgi:hypothetical protein
MNKLREKIECEGKIDYIYHTLKHIGQIEKNSGFHYMVWGTAIALAMMVHFILLLNSVSDIAIYGWISITIVASIMSVIYFLSARKKNKIRSYETDHSCSISLVFHLFLFLLLFFIGQDKEYSIPIIYMVYGAWLLITGSIMKFRPFVLGGILNWILALIFIYASLSLSNQLLLGAIVCLLSYTLPGYLLNKRTIKNA